MARLTKNQKRRLKKKQGNTAAPVDPLELIKQKHAQKNAEKQKSEDPAVDIQVEYVSEAVPQDETIAKELGSVFEKFMKPEELLAPSTSSTSKTKSASDTDGSNANGPGAQGGDDDDNGGDEDDDLDPTKLSKKKRKLMSRLRVAELKQLVQRPEVVEQHDVTSADPRLLVFLKGYRNTVPVPRHWSHKRKYLQGKRGIEKPPWQLPEFIAQTGIDKVRQAIEEKDASMKTKSKTRERVKPKMGKIDLDYQVLQDAFFKYQTKPKLTRHGQLYYEGAEFEVDKKEKIPGQLSEELRQALGMPDNAPPPWLVYMQRVGPPPSYPHLKIPGLNCPIPPGAEWGFHAGGWGEAPVDQFKNPLYGDVFGSISGNLPAMAEVDKSRWGELQPDSESEESESEEEDDDMDEDHHTAEAQRGATDQSQPEAGSSEQDAAPTTNTVPPPAPHTQEGILDLRKGIQQPAPGEGVPPPPAAPKELFTVLEEKKTGVGSSLYGAEHKYVVPGKASGVAAGSGVDVALNPEELGDEEMLKIRYQEGLENKQQAKRADDMSDLHAEQEKKLLKAKRKREKKEKAKYENFKF